MPIYPIVFLILGTIVVIYAGVKMFQLPEARRYQRPPINFSVTADADIVYNKMEDTANE